MWDESDELTLWNRIAYVKYVSECLSKNIEAALKCYIV